MDGRFSTNLYSSFFICNNEESLILIIPFLFTSVTSDKFIVKIGLDLTLFVFSIINIVLDFYYNPNKIELLREEILPNKGNLTNLLYLQNTTDVKNSIPDINKSLPKNNENSVLHYDLIILCFFSFLHFLYLLKQRNKINKMLSFIKEKQYLKSKFTLNKDDDENKKIRIYHQNEINNGFYTYEILDINNYVINPKIKEDIFKKIFSNFFSNNFSNLEFLCLTCSAKIKALGKIDEYLFIINKLNIYIINLDYYTFIFLSYKIFI